MWPWRKEIPTYRQIVEQQLEEAKLKLLHNAGEREYWQAMEEAGADKVRRLQKILNESEASPQASVAESSAALGLFADPRIAIGSSHLENPPRLTAVVDPERSARLREQHR